MPEYLVTVIIRKDDSKIIINRYKGTHFEELSSIENGGAKVNFILNARSKKDARNRIIEKSKARVSEILERRKKKVGKQNVD